jgi:sugar phosphate isomerase/epimerase
MPAPIGLGLYTVRADLERDFAGTLQSVAAMGYLGVETAGFPGSTPQAARRLFDDLGLTVLAAHSPLPVGERQNEVLDTLAALGCQRLVCPWQPPERFQSRDGLQQVTDTLNEANAVCRAHGLSLGYHNHWFEFGDVDGQPAYRHLLAGLAPEVFFEIDTYWVKVGGLDPAAVVAELGPRVPLLHIKDGPGERGVPMLPVGDGIMDFPALLAAAGDAPEWLVVELDEYAGNMLDAVRRSYDYLSQSGLGRGRA